MFSLIRQLFAIVAVFAAFSSPALADDDAAELMAELNKYSHLANEAIVAQDLESAIKHQEVHVLKIQEANEKYPDDKLRDQSILQSDLLAMLKVSTKLSKDKRDKLFSVVEGLAAAKEFEANFKYLELIEILNKSKDLFNKHLTASELHYLEYGLQGMLGRAYLKIGELDKSVEALSRLREIRIKCHGESHPDMLGECLLLSECKLMQGDLASADLYCRNYLEREFRIANDYGMHYAAGLSVLAMIHLSNNRMAEAEAFSLLAIAMAQKSTDKPTFLAARCHLILAEVYMLRGKQKEAKELYKKSLRTFKEVAGGNSFYFAEAAKKYAVLLKVMGDGEEAQRITNEANEMIKFYKDKFRDMSKQ